MKRRIIVTTLVLVGFAVIVIPVFAADGSVGSERRSRGSRAGSYRNSLETRAEALDMTIDELRDELNSGKSMREIMMERGVEPAAGSHRGASLEEVAASLGMSVDELRTTLMNGQNLHDLLEERGVEPPAWCGGEGRQGNDGSRRAAAVSAKRHGLGNPVLLSAKAEALGMTPEDLAADLASGMTMRDIMERQGLTAEELHAVVAEDHPEFAGRPFGEMTGGHARGQR